MGVARGIMRPAHFRALVLINDFLFSRVVLSVRWVGNLDQVASAATVVGTSLAGAFGKMKEGISFLRQSSIGTSPRGSSPGDHSASSAFFGTTDLGEQPKAAVVSPSPTSAPARCAALDWMPELYWM